MKRDDAHRGSQPGSHGFQQGAAGALHLTPRQREVLVLLSEGLPNKLICRQLNISAGTVKVHISCILRELGVTSRLQAVVWARRHGLLPEAFGATRNASAAIGAGQQIFAAPPSET